MNKLLWLALGAWVVLLVYKYFLLGGFHVDQIAKNYLRLYYKITVILLNSPFLVVAFYSTLKEFNLKKIKLIFLGTLQLCIQLLLA